MQTTLIYRFDPIDTTPLEAIRITAKTVTIRELGAQARLAKQATEQWRAELPVNAPAAESEPPGPAPELPLAPTDDTEPEDALKYQMYLRWATAVAGTAHIDVVRRRVLAKDEAPPPELDPDQPHAWPWEPSSLVALGWDQPQGILDVKTDLFAAWEKAVQDANPGVFGRALTSGAKKKTGVISIT